MKTSSALLWNLHILVVLIYVVVIVTSQYYSDSGDGRSSICQSYGYRDLSPSLKLEHQCLLLEQIQAEFFTDMDDRIRRYKELHV